MQKPAHRFIPLCAATIILAGPAFGDTNMLTLAQAVPGQDGPDIGASEIIVDSSDGGRYDIIKTQQIDLWFRLSLNKLPDKEPLIPFEKMSVTNEIDRVEISAEGITIPATGANYSAKRYKLSFPYAHPHSPSVVNQRNSPVDTCNKRLDSLEGAAREEFRSKGARIEIASAFPARARGFIEFRRTTGPDKGKMVIVRTHDDNIKAKVTLVCRALNVPKPRTQTSTQGVPPKPGKRMEPTISEAELRIEPAQMIAVDGQTCPSQLQLRGRIQTIREFEGKAVIFGPGYFSPVSELTYTHGGNRNIVASYPLKWDGIGGLATGPDAPLKSQTISLTMNVTTKDNKVLKQAEQSIKVSCKRIAQMVVIDTGGTPPAGTKTPDAKVTMAPPPPVVVAEPAAARAVRTRNADFFLKRPKGGALLPGVDASVRKVDRSGPGGTTRLWVRNGGDKAASQCKLFAKREGHKDWILIESMSSPLAPGATTEIGAALPSDPALSFAVDCPGEEENRLDNNVAKLD